MVSIVDMLKRSEKFSLAFDRSMPIRFQQQFWQLIAFLDKHEITWFNDEPASDHAMCQQLLGQVWRQDCQDVVLNFETQERYLGWQVDEETDELSVIIEDVYGFRWNSLLDLTTVLKILKNLLKIMWILVNCLNNLVNSFIKKKVY